MIEFTFNPEFKSRDISSMNKRLLWNTIGTTSLFCIGIVTSLIQPSTATTINIVCKTNASMPTVIATSSEPDSKKDVTLLSFLPQYFSSQSAIQSCQNAAKRLQALYNKDDANYLTSDKLNAQPVICAVERRGIGCNHNSAQVLFTLEPTANPTQALYEMLGQDFKQPQPPNVRTVGRIYSDINPHRFHWWFF